MAEDKHPSPNLPNLVNRKIPPEPWEEGRTIPWDDPEFSERMLQEHLTQEHDHASRRLNIIDQHVAWIDNELLRRNPSKILDLGCGPGLYIQRLAASGHRCTGIDFSPASIRYAHQQAEAAGLHIEYILADLRDVEFDSGYDLVMMIFGEFNVFPIDEGIDVLNRASHALKRGGVLLLEVSTFEGVREIGSQLTSWYTASSGLFSPDPHIVLYETFWNEEHRVSTERYFIIDLETAELTSMTIHQQAYHEDELVKMLEGCGYEQVTFIRSVPFLTNPSQSLVFLTSRKPQV